MSKRLTKNLQDREQKRQEQKKKKKKDNLQKKILFTISRTNRVFKK